MENVLPGEVEAKVKGAKEKPCVSLPGLFVMGETGSSGMGSHWE